MPEADVKPTRPAIDRLATWCRSLGAVTFILYLALIYGNEQILAERRHMVQAGPPARVSLGAYDPRRDVSPLGEVHFLARADFSAAFSQQIALRDKRITIVGVPLFAPDGPDDRALAMMYFVQDAAAGAFAYPPGLADAVVSNGAAGPVLDLNGTVGAAPAVARALIDARRSAGLTLAPAAVMFAPFTQGRMAALGARAASPLTRTMFLLCMTMLLSSVLVGRLHRLANRPRPSPKTARPLELPRPVHPKARLAAEIHFYPLVPQDDLTPPSLPAVQIERFSNRISRLVSRSDTARG